MRLFRCIPLNIISQVVEIGFLENSVGLDGSSFSDPLRFALPPPNLMRKTQGCNPALFSFAYQ
jgi:hypothetical protein